MKRLDIKLRKERQCLITKQLVNSFTSVNITILGLTNPDFNLKKMHQLYIVNAPMISKYGTNIDFPYTFDILMTSSIVFIYQQQIFVFQTVSAILNSFIVPE